MIPNVEMTNAGLKCKGSWDDICDFARELEGVMKECVANEDSIEQFDEWRPRENEDYSDMTERTAEKAAIGEKHVEEEFNGAKQEMKDVEADVKKAFDDVINGGKAGEDIKDSSKHFERLVEAESVRSLRKIEEIIYKKIMLKFNPDYFDTENFSVNLEKNHEDYVLTINVTDEDNRKSIKDLVKREEEI